MPYRSSLALSLLLALSLVTFACSDPPDDDVGPSFDPNGCTNALIPHEMGFRWEKLNHRVSNWRFELQSDAETGCDSNRLSAKFIGGDFTTGMGTGFDDTPMLDFGYQRWKSPDLTEAAAAVQTVEATIGPGGLAEGTETWSRPDLNLEGYDRVVPFVHGYSFDTGVEQDDEYPEDYDPAHGYTLRGFGAGVEVVDTGPHSLEIRWRLRFQPGASEDREKHNRAVPHAKIGARLHILLVGVNTAPVHVGEVDYRMEYEKPEIGQDEPLERPPEDKTGIELDGAADAPRGLYGLQSFDFTFDPDIDCDDGGECPEGDSCGMDGQCKQTYGPPGYYLRELETDLTLADFSTDTGRARFRLSGFASNATQLIAFYPLKSHFRGRMAWIQVDGAGESTRLERDFETGETSVELD